MLFVLAVAQAPVLHGPLDAGLAELRAQLRLRHDAIRQQGGPLPAHGRGQLSPGLICCIAAASFLLIAAFASLSVLAALSVMIPASVC